MKQKFRKIMSWLILAAIVAMPLGDILTRNVYAAAPGPVVINEVAWAGSADSSYDEWIELYNSSDADTDLTGWTIVDDNGASIYKLDGKISAHGFYLIEKSENTVTPNVANAIVSLSLANSGDSLVLLDASGNTVDSANGSGGAWAAGDAVSKASMERKDPAVSGDDASNWVTSSGEGSTAKASGGSLIVGTPGIVNSPGQAGAGSGSGVASGSFALNLSSATPKIGETLVVSADVKDVTDLFFYGFDLGYDPAVLKFKTVKQGGFLGSGGSVLTSFEAGLENNLPGKLLVAEARTIADKTGANGSGQLFTIEFDVLGGAGKSSLLNLDSSSFLASASKDLDVNLVDVKFTPAEIKKADPAKSALVVAGVNRYSLELKWVAPVSGADTYKVFRKDALGNFVLLGQPAQISFVDSDSVKSGGKIVPNLDYIYSVVAVKAGVESDPLEFSAKESRGLKGDLDRSDRVDGRDLQKLSEHFGQLQGDSGFDPLLDTTYDGKIDGSDLIDLAANFAKTYKA